MSSSGARARTLGRLYRGRGGEQHGDRSYAVYLALLLVVVVGVPLVRGAVLALAQPDVLVALLAPRTPRVAGTVLALVLAAAAALGQVRGPVVLRPFAVTLLAGTDLPRERTLAPAFLVSSAWLLVGFLVPAALVAAVLVTSGAAPPATGMLVVALALLAALATSLAGLAGQRLGRRTAWVLPTALVVLSPLPAVAPMAAAVLLLAAVIAGGVLAPRALHGLSGPSLLAQARRSTSMTLAAQTGDLAEAAQRLQQEPSGTGRAWRAVRPLPSWLRVPVRDLVAAARTPGRLAAGVLGLVACAVLLSVSLGAPGTSRWWLAGLAGVIGCVALGPVSGGVQHATWSASVPALYGYRPTGLVARHTVLPLVMAVVCAVAGSVVGTVRVPAAPAASVRGTIGVAVVLVLLVVVRLHRSARGALPPWLLTPALTPLGDASSLMVVAWNLDWVLAATLAGVLGTGLASTRPTLAAAGSVVLAAVLVLHTRARLHAR